MPTKFQKAGKSGCEVMLKLSRDGWYIATGTSSWAFFLIIFLFFSNIATKYAYQVSKGCEKWL